jgi:two-component system OmpR family sensor kinase
MTINDLLARLEVAFREREQALEEQRRFVADASHELRTPLTSILGYTRMLRQWGLEHPEAAKEGIDALEQEAGRMHRLVESMLRLARGEELPAMNRTVNDLGAVISDAVEAAKAFDGGQQEIAMTLPEHPVRATVDRGMLLQVIEILLDNAVKYAGSTKPVEVSLHADGGNAVIRVIDHGPGVAPEHLPNLFERFYRAEQSRTTRGSGLGLAIAKQIVEQHSGIIDVDSTLGEGTTFTITLQVASFNM